MLLRAEFVSLALRLQDIADGKIDATEAGARHSKQDTQLLQTIHDHAVNLGAACAMAEASKGSGTAADSVLSLSESAETLETIVLKEAKSDYEIKLISPGKGSSAFYPAEVLKRDGPSVFRAGTHVYLNHPTAAEEAARPEGDVKNLAGVLATGAVYHEAHAKGPGLYARMKVFADHGQLVEEKAPHVGMSIRASGVAEAGKTREGVPVLKQLTGAESVDVVTHAGAGGLILTESARDGAEHSPNPAPIDRTTPSSTRQSVAPIQTQEAAMDAAEMTKLQEAVAVQAAANKKLLERALRGDAREAAGRILTEVTLPEASKARVIESVLSRDVPTTDGELDLVKFAEAVNAEAKREGQYVAGLTGSGRVVGMGSGAPEAAVTETLKPEEINARSVKIFQRLGLSESAAKAAVRGRVA